MPFNGQPSATVTQFWKRLAYHAQQGHGGAELYRQLASDAEVAPFFDQPEVAEILGVSGEALKQRRALGRPPEYIKLSQNLIRYPRDAVCMLLADNYRTMRREAAE